MLGFDYYFYENTDDFNYSHRKFFPIIGRVTKRLNQVGSDIDFINNGEVIINNQYYPTVARVKTSTIPSALLEELPEEYNKVDYLIVECWDLS